jgi:alkanesulfonate monooxygenase SsuD/methylene tetrahydromethanopterin reductase-like flavin-dependent oxidoreductase (luciferase family)
VQMSISLPRPGGSPDGSIAACDRLAQVGEESGFHAISASDHPFPYLGEGSPSHQALDPFALLAYLAAKTTRIRLQFSPSSTDSNAPTTGAVCRIRSADRRRDGPCGPHALGRHAAGSSHA